MTNKTESGAKHTGMGAIPHAGGVAFRVWAPHADHVFVIGDFNEWSESANPLEKEEEGFWYIDVPAAQVGQEYRYLIHNGDQQLSKNDPYARAVTHSAGNSIICDPEFDWGADQYKLPAWNEIIIYETHIGTFNQKESGSPGDFYSLVEKLPYLRDLGINVIGLMPVNEFPGDFSWGYNPAHPFSVESKYGGPGGLKELVKAAHQHGIGVILDVVYNHFGPDDLDLWQFDGWHENDKGGIYFYNDWRSRTPWAHTRPNYGHGEVRQYLHDNALMWLNDYHLDGLRWDGTAFIRNVDGTEGDQAAELPEGWSLLQWIHEDIHAKHPGALSVAEDLRNNEWITKDTGAGGAGFSSQWDANFVHPVRNLIITPADESRDMFALRDALGHHYGEDVFHRVIYTESHDEVANGRSRVPEEIWPGNVDNWFSMKRSTLGAVIVLTTPGIPLLFQGQEFLEDRWFHDRDPLDWARTEQFSGLVDMYRELIALRRNSNHHSRGLTGQGLDVFHINNQDKVIAYHRWAEGGPKDSVVVVLNLANRSHENYQIGFPRSGLWKLRFNSDWEGYHHSFENYPTRDCEAMSGERDNLPGNGALALGPYSAVIFSQDECRS